MTPPAAPDEHLRAILDSPTYRLAYEDIDLLGQDDLRPLRLQLELLKPCKSGLMDGDWSVMESGSSLAFF